MKMFVLAMTVGSLMMSSGVCGGPMTVAPTKSVTNDSTSASSGNISNVVLPLAIVLRMEKDKVVEVIGCRVIDSIGLHDELNKQATNSSAEVMTYSLGNGLSLIGIGVLNAATGVVVLVGVIVRGLAPYAKEAMVMTATAVGNAFKTICQKISSSVATGKAEQRGAAAEAA